jgi:LPS export ABC transporter permease LptF/LPS export ABC transporter permease LptG
MRIIDRYICREVLSHALLGLAVFTFVFFVPQLVQLMDLVVRHSGTPGQLAELFLCLFPGVLTFTLPIAVLVGVLIGLGRMSADSELIAMNAVGMGARRLLLPIGAFALAGVVLTLCMTLWLGPISIRTFRTLADRLRASQASFQIQPRVFDERFPHLVLYVQDVSAAATRWHGIFLAESDLGDVSRLTLAENAIVIAQRDQDKLELHLDNGSTHEFSPRDPNHYALSVFAQRDLSINISDLAGQETRELTNAERSLSALAARRGADALPARVELQRRFAFPLACLVFALAAIPLGARPRRGGRAAGFLIAILLVCAYYAVFIVGAGLARNGKIPPWLGIWAANIALAVGGLALMPRVERMPGESALRRLLDTFADWSRWRPWGKHRPSNSTELSPATAERAPNRALQIDTFARRARTAPPAPRRTGGFPQLLDFYLLRNFLFYFLLLLTGFLLLSETITFFSLLNDIALHHIAALVVANYFRYLSCFLFYELAPLACLVSVMVTLGVMTKNNELVALKASGVSLYRISLPLIGAGFLVAATLFSLDATFLPYANQRQDALHNEIRGRPAQTYYQPRRQWIFGYDSKIYNYELFDADRQLFGGLNVFELDPATFAVRRRVYAARAHWEPQQEAWILESGWVRDFQNGRILRFLPFSVLELPELTESPAYFNREVRQSYQMNWWELRQYIAELRQAGFDVARLSVQWQKKLAFPLIAPIVILLAIPFSILVGTRGAVGGLALGVSVGVAYWASSALFEALGGVGQLPPVMAAWAPDAIFFFIGVYFFLKMPT